MEKFTQYRDRGTGIAPFIPIPYSNTGTHLPVATLLFALKAPVLFTLSLSYFVVLQFMPLGALFQKGILWVLLLVAGVWWVDLQVEGVKRGTLSRNADKLPSPGSIIASTFTSPLDALYLAATFDPIFVIPSPDSANVFQLSLFQAMLYAFSAPSSEPYSSRPTTLADVISKNPHRIIAIFPEGTSSNGRALLRFAPALDDYASQRKAATGDVSPIFPISLRYVPANTTTPIPYSYGIFLWRLLGQPSHTIKVRIGEVIKLENLEAEKSDTLATSSSSETITEKTLLREHDHSDSKAPKSGILEDKVGETLARVGRVRRVGLGMKEKIGFWNAWTSQGKRKRG